MDASIVCTHMMLEAEALDLGSVWILLFDPQRVKDQFQLPDNIKPICLLSVGYPAADAVPYEPWHNTFRELDDIAVEI